MTLVQVSSPCVFLNFRYSSKYFAQICRAQYGAAILVYLFGTPTWRPDNSVNICDLLRLSGRLIICTEQTSMNRLKITRWEYIFPQSRRSFNVTHRHNSEIQNALVSRRSKLLSWKVVNRYQFSPSDAWCGYKLWWIFSFGFWKMMTSHPSQELFVNGSIVIGWSGSIGLA